MNDVIRDLIGGITMKSVGLVASLYVCLVFLNLLYQLNSTQLFLLTSVLLFHSAYVIPANFVFSRYFFNF
jgi:hypothetical protein